MKEDLVNQTFGRLIVISKDVKKASDGKTKWVCRCSNDGNIVSVRGRDLKNGKTKSCGCLRNETIVKTASTHGLSSTREYSIWCNMKSRCYNPKATSYPSYGAVGVDMCPEWRDSFEAFYRDMGPSPSPTHSIDRMDNSKGYSRDNCRWATPSMQAENRNNVTHYDHDGERLTLAEIARRYGLKDQTLRDRVKAGMSISEALSSERRLPNLKYAHDGLELTLSEWAAKLQMNRSTLGVRMSRMSLAEALSKPVVGRR